MKPYEIKIYLYAENEAEAREAQQAAYEFVSGNYNEGIIVTARKCTEALRKFKNNFFVKNFLR